MLPQTLCSAPTSSSSIFSEKIRSLYHHSSDINPFLKTVLDYHFQTEGSLIRAHLTHDLCLNLGLSQDDCVTLACIPELLHNASLIHDDICDQGLMRRHNKSIWFKYGSSVALCAGDFLISLAYQAVKNLPSVRQADVLVAVHKSIEKTISGQISEAALSSDQTLDSLKVYNRICEQKTGALFVLSGILPFIAAQAIIHIPVIENWLHQFSIIYQIQDDLTDKTFDQSKKGTHAGLNILTVFEEKGETEPESAVINYTVGQIDAAKSLVTGLPLPTQDVFSRLLSKIEEKLIRDV